MASRALLCLPFLATLLAAVAASSSAVSVVKLIAVLDGQYDSPPDPTGNGVSIVEIYKKSGRKGKVVRARWTVTVQNLTDGSFPKGSGASGVVAMHIHNGTFGNSGPVIFNFGPIFIRATALGQALYGYDQRNLTLLQPLAAVIKNPEAYYVNVHTLPNYALGAVRGQLLPLSSIDPERAVPKP